MEKMVQDKIKGSRTQISKWKGRTNTNSEKCIKELKVSIDKAYTNPQISIDQIHTMRKDLEERSRVGI